MVQWLRTLMAHAEGQFGFQTPTSGDSQPSVIPTLGYPESSSGLCGHFCVYVHKYTGTYT